ncbi:MAG TPA: hypothetical protein VJI73_03950 [Candidatus Paceibacterota bacterium]
MTIDRHEHFKIKIAVSGAADTGHLPEEALTLAKEIGSEIVRQGAVLVTGATTGIPFWSAKGAKEAGGVSIGISPAKDEKDHVESYHLPIDYMDIIMYTGQGYSGRDILMTRTSDAVIECAGRIGTIHEFTVVFEDNKPLGVLEGPWETDDLIREIIKKSHREEDNKKIVYDSDPKRLVAKVIELVQKDKIEYYKIPTEGGFSRICDGPKCLPTHTVKPEQSGNPAKIN